jgi:hypothetical protein
MQAHTPLDPRIVPPCDARKLRSPKPKVTVAVHSLTVFNAAAQSERTISVGSGSNSTIRRLAVD